MRSDRLIRTAKRGYTIISLMLCAVGLMLMLAPGLPLTVIGTVVGLALGVSGVVKLIGYLSRDLYQLAFQFDLAFGILLMALSTVVLLRPEHGMGFLCLVLGITTLADGLLKIQTALDARRFGLKTWWLILLTALLAGVAGMLLTLRPSIHVQVLTVLMGAALLADGVMSLCVAVCAIKVLPPSLERDDWRS
ncbi:MAG: HdeD family acid-resistance protein [Aristaeellaceae bacterium]